MERKIDRRIGAALAVMQTLKRSALVQRELSQQAKLSVYNSIYVPTLIYGHECWDRKNEIANTNELPSQGGWAQP